MLGQIYNGYSFFHRYLESAFYRNLKCYNCFFVVAVFCLCLRPLELRGFSWSYEFSGLIHYFTFYTFSAFRYLNLWSTGPGPFYRLSFDFFFNVFITLCLLVIIFNAKNFNIFMIILMYKNCLFSYLIWSFPRRW